MKVQEIRSELIRTQKNWKMLNFGTEKLDHILTMEQSIIDRNGKRYTDISNNIATFSKTVFVKIAHTIKVSPNSNKIDKIGRAHV